MWTLQTYFSSVSMSEITMDIAAKILFYKYINFKLNKEVQVNLDSPL